MRPHRRQPTRLPRPWDSPGKNTGVGCHFLLQCMKVKSESEVAQSCLTLCDPMGCSLPGSWRSMGFSRQEHWSGLPLPSPCNRTTITFWLECLNWQRKTLHFNKSEHTNPRVTSCFAHLFQLNLWQQIWKTQQWPQDWKRSVFNSNPKERQCQIIFRPLNNCTHLIC